MLVGSDQEPAMNAFYEHHRDSIRFADRWHYLANWRMQVATQKLRNTSASPAQVAEIVGYASEAAFSRAFKKAFGAALTRELGELDSGRV
jgi:AraC-like DNA-binding protein